MTQRESARLCINCRYFAGEYAPTGCSYLAGQPHPVYGTPVIYINADNMRLGPCGWVGKFWKPREESK